MGVGGVEVVLKTIFYRFGGVSFGFSLHTGLFNWYRSTNWADQCF